MPAILDLIRELADYEHELSSVQATPETLLATIAFSSSPKPLGPGPQSLPETEPTSPARPARCILIFPSDRPSENETPVGMALYFYNYSTWRARPGIYLEDLFVRKDARGNGYGQALLQQLARETVAMGGGRLEWAVLKWNEPSIKFYESQAVGATMMSEWVGMRVDGEKLIKLAGGR